MKNIFKFMGIALMASSMMVACSGDDEEVIENEYTLTWDGTVQHPGYASAFTSKDYANTYIFQAAAASNGTELSCPAYTVYMEGTTAEDMLIDAANTEVAIEGWYPRNGVLYADWQLEDEDIATQMFDVTAFDATTKVMSATASLTFYSLDEYMEDSVNYSRKVMGLTLSNYDFSAVK